MTVPRRWSVLLQQSRKVSWPEHQKRNEFFFFFFCICLRSKLETASDSGESDNNNNAGEEGGEEAEEEEDDDEYDEEYVPEWHEDYDEDDIDEDDFFSDDDESENLERDFSPFDWTSMTTRSPPPRKHDHFLFVPPWTESSKAVEGHKNTGNTCKCAERI